ncbi:MAG: PorT family protein [Bacteroidales bacterium]|nr:PorT family protein [Bacteroidales bacterium]
MKKLVLMITCCLLLASSYGQRFIGSLIFGGNVSQVEGDDVRGYKKPGVVGGASVMIALDKKMQWFATVELLYSQKGSRSAGTRAFDTTNYAPAMFLDVNREEGFHQSAKYKCRLNLDYVEVPVLFHYEDWHSGCAIGLGFAWGRLVRAQEWYNGFKRTTNINSGTYRTSDWSVVADLKFMIYKGLKLEFRFQYSLRPIRNFVIEYSNVAQSTEYKKQRNNLFSVRLIYSFNEKFIENTHENRYGQRQGVKWIRETNVYDD